MTPAGRPTFRNGPEGRPRHGLGPHVVGQRVVVRRVLPGQTGPTGGPAMTDVLGICETWADGRTLIRREDGSVVEIAVADIVSGKPVPPRPSPRLRVSTREAESHAGPLWPGVVREPLGEWELRTEPEPVGRLLKRTNSCLAIGDPEMPFADASRRIVGFYADRGRNALVQVETDSAQERAFADAGWVDVPGGAAHFMLGAVSGVRRALGRLEAVEVAIEGPRVTASIGDEAIGHGGLDGDWLGVHGLQVDPAVRRTGLGSRVLAGLLEWGAEQGATTVWLHVETGNEAATAFYERLGLSVHHRCRYLAPAP